MLEAFALLVLGAGVGTIGTVVGAGGGFLLVPILAVFEPDLKTSALTAISLGMVTLNAASGSVAFVRQRRVDFGSAIPFAIATLPGSVIGAILTRSIARGIFDILFALLLVSLALFLAFRRAPTPSAGPARGWGVVDRAVTDAAGTVYRFRTHLPAGIAVAVIVGVLAAVFGVGGGTMMVPVMVAFLGFPPHVATATSTIVLLVTAATATATHLVGGDLEGLLTQTILLGVGAVFGAQLGARLSQRMRGSMIARLMAACLAFAALRLAIQAMSRA